jgi:hypothetical protein
MMNLKYDGFIMDLIYDGFGIWIWNIVNLKYDEFGNDGFGI